MVMANGAKSHNAYGYDRRTPIGTKFDRKISGRLANCRHRDADPVAMPAHQAHAEDTYRHRRAAARGASGGRKEKISASSYLLSLSAHSYILLFSRRRVLYGEGV